jgi:ferredoxin
MIGFMIVDKKCAACGTCVAVCPFDAIRIKDRAVIDPEKCTKCGLCVKACPLGAIKKE